MFQCRRLARIEEKLDKLLTGQAVSLAKGRLIMATLADLATAVAAEKTVVDSAVTLLGGLSQQLKDALASGDPNAIQAIIDSVDAQKQELADAVTANTPAAAPPTP